MHPTFRKVTMNISISNGRTNVTHINDTNKHRHPDEKVFHQEQPRAQIRSSQQVSVSKTHTSYKAPQKGHID